MSRYYGTNLYDDIDRWMEEQDKWLRKRPLCCWCDEHIQGFKLWNINEKLYCEDCLEGLKVWTDGLDDPVCSECGKDLDIQGTAYKIDGKVYCDSCMNNHAQYTDDYI